MYSFCQKKPILALNIIYSNISITNLNSDMSKFIVLRYITFNNKLIFYGMKGVLTG